MVNFDELLAVIIMHHAIFKELILNKNLLFPKIFHCAIWNSLKYAVQPIYKNHKVHLAYCQMFITAFI